MRPTTLAIFTIRPQRFFSIGRSRACVSRNAPVRLVPSTSSQSPRFMAIISPSRVMPALLTRISTLPKRSSTAFAPALIESSLATSSGIAAACPPKPSISATASASFVSLRAANTTVAPARANSSAHARPIPCEAPVTSAIRPSKSAILSRSPSPCAPRRALSLPIISGQKSEPCSSATVPRPRPETRPPGTPPRSLN